MNNKTLTIRGRSTIITLMSVVILTMCISAPVFISLSPFRQTYSNRWGSVVLIPFGAFQIPSWTKSRLNIIPMSSQSARLYASTHQWQNINIIASIYLQGMTEGLQRKVYLLHNVSYVLHDLGHQGSFTYLGISIFDIDAGPWTNNRTNRQSELWPLNPSMVYHGN